MAKEISIIRQEAQQVQNATQVGENTAQRVGGVLTDLVDRIATIRGATYMGVATPTTNPVAPDGNVFYFATQAGIYSNFGGLSVDDGEAAVLKYNGSAWSKDTTGLALEKKVTELESQLVVLDNKEPIAFNEAISKIKNKQENMIIAFNELNVGVVSYQLLDADKSFLNRAWVKYNSGFRLGYINTDLQLKNTDDSDYQYHHKIIPVVKGDRYKIEYFDAEFSDIVSIVAGYENDSQKYTRVYIKGTASRKILSKEFIAQDDYIVISVNSTEEFYSLSNISVNLTYDYGYSSYLLQDIISELNYAKKKGTKIILKGVTYEFISDVLDDWENILTSWAIKKNNNNFFLGYYKTDLSKVDSGEGYGNYCNGVISVEPDKYYKLSYTSEQYANIVSIISETEDGINPTKCIAIGKSFVGQDSLIFKSSTQKIIMCIPTASEYTLEKIDIRQIDLSHYSTKTGSNRINKKYDEGAYAGGYKTIEKIPVVRGHFYLVKFKGETHSRIVSIVSAIDTNGSILGTQIIGRANDSEINAATFKAITDEISLSFPYNYIELYDLGCELTFDTIVLFGDSITEEWNTTSGDYVNRVKAKFNCNNVVKKGFGGYTLAGEDSSTSLPGKVSEVVAENPQLILLLAGTNDFGKSRTLGTYTDEANYNGTSCAGLKYIIDYIIKNSDANILYCTPLPRAGNTENMYKYVYEFMKTIYTYKVENPNYADRIMVLDGYSYAMFDTVKENNADTRLYTTDGLHLSYIGYERLTDLQKTAVINNLKGNYYSAS